jgi:hypothetical protein
MRKWIDVKYCVSDHRLRISDLGPIVVPMSHSKSICRFGPDKRVLVLQRNRRSMVLGR